MKGAWEAVPWIVAVAGWLATHLLSEARERRKEARDRLDALLEQLEGLEKATFDFHLSPEFDDAAASSILASLDRWERSAMRIQMLDLDGLVPMLVHHRRAITLQNFDASNFSQQSRASEVLADIADATAELGDEVERQYAARYPSTFPYFSKLAFRRGRPAAPNLEQ